MRITVVAHPKSSIEKIENKDEHNFELYFSVPPEKGKANHKVVEMLSDYFKIPKSSINLVSGVKSRIKIFEIQY